MEDLNFHLFGKFQAITKNGDPVEIDVRKVQELLCYLLLFRYRPHSRDIIADILWVNNPTDQSRSYLRRTLWQLQNILEHSNCRFDQPLLKVDQDWLQINPLAKIWIDVEMFEKTYGIVKGTQGESFSEKMADMVNVAVDLQHSILLEGWYSNWCIYERERLQHIYHVMLDKLIRYCEVNSLFEKGIDYGLRILRQNQTREYTHRQLMRLYYLAGDRSTALLQYERCVQALKGELGVETTERTRRLYEIIKEDLYTEVLNPRSTPANAIVRDQTTLQELLSKLTQARTDARHLSNQLDLQIDIVRKLLSK